METRTAQIDMHPSGCIIVRAKGVSQTLDDAKENVHASLQLSSGEKQHPILVNISKSATLSSEVRHYYVGGALAENFTRLGLVVEASPLGRMMGNVFFRMMDTVNHASTTKKGITTKLFSDEESAIAWLTAGKE